MQGIPVPTQDRSINIKINEQEIIHAQSIEQFRKALAKTPDGANVSLSYYCENGDIPLQFYYYTVKDRELIDAMTTALRDKRLNHLCITVGDLSVRSLLSSLLSIVNSVQSLDIEVTLNYHDRTQGGFGDVTVPLSKFCGMGPQFQFALAELLTKWPTEKPLSISLKGPSDDPFEVYNLFTAMNSASPFSQAIMVALRQKKNIDFTGRLVDEKGTLLNVRPLPSTLTPTAAMLPVSSSLAVHGVFPSPTGPVDSSCEPLLGIERDQIHSGIQSGSRQSSNPSAKKKEDRCHCVIL